MILLKVPFSGGGLGKANGSELAPDKIIEQMHKLFLNESGFNPAFKAEDVTVNQTSLEETNQNIFKGVSESLSKTQGKDNEKVMVLGGDHSITYTCFKAFAEKNPGAGIIVFDAHPDCENDFSPPTQEDLIIVLLKERIASPEKVILIGTRNWSGNEKEFLESNKIRFFSMKKISHEGLQEICDIVMESARQWPSLYISIDIDSVDPAFAPGTGYCEPGGLTSRELLYFLQRLKLLKNLKMLDLVEINPKKDVNDITSKLGAKIVKEMG